jgi:hypothetical protein
MPTSNHTFSPAVYVQVVTFPPVRTSARGATDAIFGSVADPRRAGINEDDLWAAYQRKCNRHRVVPLWGQLRNGLVSLHKEGKIYTKTVGDHKLCLKR